MLHEFLTTHRAALIGRCTSLEATRKSRRPGAGAMDHGIPVFLDQVIRTLRVEQSGGRGAQSREISGAPTGDPGGASEIGASAVLHGREMLLQGFTLEQVVHDYGDLCQAISDQAFELGAPITVDEFRTLNRCLDNGIADAVMAHGRHHDRIVVESHADNVDEHLGDFARELRTLVYSAMLALTAIRGGAVGIGGVTGGILERSLQQLRVLIDSSLEKDRAATNEGSWRSRLDEAKSPEAKLAVCNEFVARWKPEEITQLPPDCRPKARFEIAEIYPFALKLIQHLETGTRITDPLLHRLSIFFTTAALQLAQGTAPAAA